MMNRVVAQDYTDECPTRFGFYADAVQCDRYYECKDGEVRLLRILVLETNNSRIDKLVS